VAFERANRRKAAFTGRCDPRVHVSSGFVTYIEQFYAVTWESVCDSTGWRPSRAFIIGRSKLDAESSRYLAEFDRKNRK
jgi:hypothetical protein